MENFDLKLTVCIDEQFVENGQKNIAIHLV